MNILLLNSNPVVNKLVTLSVQKTSDELHTAENIEAIESGDYDLLIIDDALYSDEAMDEIASKISFSESLFICSKDAQERAEFTKTLKKPFLPTDLVETLIALAKMVDTVELDKMDSIEESDFDALADDALFHDFETDESLDDLDDLDALEEVEDLDMFDTSDEAAYNDAALEDVKEEGVLDKDELQEVQSLLEETETEGFDDFDFGTTPDEEEDDALDFEDDALELEDIQTPKEELMEDSFSFEEEELEEDALHGLEEETDEEEMLDFEEEAQEEVEPQEELEETLDEDDFEEEELEEDDLEEELEEVEPQEEVEKALQEDEVEEENLEEEELEEEFEEEDLASQIQEAVDSLSDEDLQSELDEDILLSIGSLTSRDLKLAIGEEVQEEQPDFYDAKTSQDATSETTEVQRSIEHSNQNGNGVEALKKLLKALSNEDVAASLQGMKININITLGDA